MAIVEVTRPVTGGVDTHLDSHVAAVLDGTGGVLGVESFPTTPAGFTELHDWMICFGDIERVGVEGPARTALVSRASCVVAGWR